MSASQQLSRQLKLSKQQATTIERASWSVVPKLFDDLVSTQRPVLMEVACHPQSTLSEAIRSDLSDPQSAIRCSQWNACDLATEEGILMIIRQIEGLQPRHVWLSPPCSSFSPLQNLSSRTTQEEEVLRNKRRENLQAISGVVSVFQHCVQTGVHVTWEMPERCQAWRLPLLHRLRERYGLYQAVAKGCRVGHRKQAESPSMQNGWKILTTQQRLAQLLDLPCKCSRDYKHDRCEGPNLKEHSMYPKEFARRAVQALTQELNVSTVQQECQGSSVLLSAFGEGLCCTCEDLSKVVGHKRCASCLTTGLWESSSEAPSNSASSPLRSEVIQNDNDTLFRWLEASESQVTHKLSSSQGDLTADAPDVEALAQHVDRASCFGRIQQIEVIAQQLLKNQDFQHENCEQLLELIPKHTPSRKRPMIKPQASQYLVLGMYAYGNHYGVTNKTRQFPKLTQYLRAYMQHHHGDTLDCNALLVSCNARHPVHRDLHNDPEKRNVVIG